MDTHNVQVANGEGHAKLGGLAHKQLMDMLEKNAGMREKEKQVFNKLSENLAS